MQDIKAIIFDLGGVIIDLDIKASITALVQLTGLTEQEIVDKYSSNDFFRSYEKGLISDEEFRNEVSLMAGHQLLAGDIDKAWNAMLIELPANRVNLAKKLGRSYQTIVLSNTNQIHVDAFNYMLRSATGYDDLNHFFHHVYFSHLLNMRKPDAEIFQYVIDQHQLIPSETLFLDDNLDNLEAAENLGIKTRHIDQPDRLFDIFA